MGWLTSIHRQTEALDRPATFDTVAGLELASWSSDSLGLDWIDALARNGKAVDLGGDGYPRRYTITVANFLQEIVHGPPGTAIFADGTTPRPDEEIWIYSSRVNRAGIAECRTDEWLLVDAWDST